MIQNETPVERFFQEFQRDSNSDCIPSMVSHFAETFLAASPQGTQCVRSSEFALSLPQRKQLFARLGCQPAALVSLQETPIDNRYIMAKTTWRLNFVSGDADVDEILVESTYLLDTSCSRFRIVLYLAHQDILKILRGRGILKS